MDVFLESGIPFILWLQRFSPGLDGFFKGITLLGNQEFFLVFLPLVYWCIHRRTGVRLAVIFLFSAYVNFAVKVMAGLPRPFDFDTRVRAIVHASGNGFPSGHTQGAVVLWGFLAVVFRRTWLWMLAAVLMVLVPLSRLYLGVHFPLDLLGGYLIGGSLLGVGLWAEPKVAGGSLPFPFHVGSDLRFLLPCCWSWDFPEAMRRGDRRRRPGRHGRRFCSRTPLGGLSC